MRNRSGDRRGGDRRTLTMVIIMNVVDAVMSWDALVYLGASLMGWWSIAGIRTLPLGRDERPAVAVIIPARNEEEQIEQAVRSILGHLRSGDEVVVVDDHSTDATAERAIAAGARVIGAPVPEQGWMGKPHACQVGVDATTAEILVFVDADVRMVGPDVVNRLVGCLQAKPDSLVSVQPYHLPGSMSERGAALFNVVSIMGSGAGRLAWRTSRALAFGPVMACRRDRYLAHGGHAHSSVRGSIIEDVSLGQLFASSDVYVGTADTITFRMYPGGLRAMMNGFTKNMARGLGATSAINSVAAALWMTALIGALVTSPLLYAASVVQVAIVQRRVGSFGWWAAIAYPVNAALVVFVLARSALVVLGVGRVTWAGRRLP